MPARYFLKALAAWLPGVHILRFKEDFVIIFFIYILEIMKQTFNIPTAAGVQLACINHNSFRHVSYNYKVNRDKKLLFGLLTLLITFLPFHTLVTVWLTKTFGYVYAWSAWKELAIFLAALLGIVILLKNSGLWREIFRHTYNKVAVAYLILLVIYVIPNINNPGALISFAIHARFVVVFLVAQLSAYFYPDSFRKWSRLVVGLAIASALFGLLQVTILPPNILEYFGYDPPAINTPGIPPAIHQVSADSGIYRAQAGMRGPNALGAYLILPLLICLRSLITLPDKRKMIYMVILALGLIMTYSRSAWLVFIVAGFAGVLWWIKPVYRRPTIIVSTVLLIVFVALSFRIISTENFRSVILHKNDKVAAHQSNEGHIELSKKALTEVVNSPFGEGLGSAGPADALDGPARIAENYYLQVGQEIGWLGVVLLLLLHVYVLMVLWQHRREDESQVLLLGLVALAFTNLLLHTWTDEAVAITFWMLAGVWLGKTSWSIAKKPTVAAKHKNKNQ